LLRLLRLKPLSKPHKKKLIDLLLNKLLLLKPPLMPLPSKRKLMT
jgi:hypothetical protein